jgi:hypothetical protein
MCQEGTASGKVLGSQKVEAGTLDQHISYFHHENVDYMNPKNTSPNK